jgi:hypothetical protein
MSVILYIGGRRLSVDTVPPTDQVAGVVFQLCGKDFGPVTGTRPYLHTLSLGTIA